MWILCGVSWTVRRNDLSEGMLVPFLYLLGEHISKLTSELYVSTGQFIK